MDAVVDVNFFDTVLGNEKSRDCLFKVKLDVSFITLKDLIVERVLAEYNAIKNGVNLGLLHLVIETEYEKKLNKVKLSEYEKYTDDKNAHFYLDQAIRAFKANRFFIIVNGTQIETLDDRVVLLENSKVEFFQLPALQGG